MTDVPGDVILFGPPVRGLVVDPVPRPGGRGVGGDDEVTFGVGLVVDGLVELRDDDGADAVGRAILQQAARGGFEIDLGLVTGGQGGEAGRLARWHAAGPAGGDRHGVGAAVAELSGRLPHRSIRGEHARDYLAGVTAHLDFGDRPGGGGNEYRARGTDVVCTRRRCSPHRSRLRCRGLRRRLRDGGGGQRPAVVGAVGSGRQDDTAEHRDDGEHSREAGTADTAS